MPVLTPYMISRAWIFSSSMPRQARMRSTASGASATGSPWRATRTTSSIVRLLPSSLTAMEISSEVGPSGSKNPRETTPTAAPCPAPGGGHRRFAYRLRPW